MRNISHLVAKCQFAARHWPLAALPRLSDSRAMTRVYASLLLALVWLAAPLAADRPITVFAAASLGDVLPSIAKTYDQEVNFSFAGSGTIARQVAAGAPADLVVLANPNWADWIELQGLSIEARVPSVAGNRLALIAPKVAKLPKGAALSDILADGRIAIGHRDAVPAGVYARQWLQTMNAWDDVADNLAETDNVRAALTLVTRGDAPLGIVYVTDAQASADVQILTVSATGTHDSIRYPALALTQAGARALTHLMRPEARAIFAAHGFEAPTP